MTRSPTAYRLRSFLVHEIILADRITLDPMSATEIIPYLLPAGTTRVPATVVFPSGRLPSLGAWFSLPYPLSSKSMGLSHPSGPAPSLSHSEGSIAWEGCPHVLCPLPPSRYPSALCDLQGIRQRHRPRASPVSPPNWDLAH